MGVVEDLNQVQQQEEINQNRGGGWCYESGGGYSCRGDFAPLKVCVGFR